MSIETSLSREDVVRLCERVEGAQVRRQPIPRLTEEYPAMGIADGYRVQTELRRRLLAQGQRLIGWKAGLTSRPKMRQMNVAEPIVGFLTDRMAVAEGTPISVSRLIHPRVECEVAFVLGRELAGGGITASDVLAATDFIVPSIEVIDSRYAGFKFDLPSVVADNGSSAFLVAGGRPRRPAGLDLRHLGVVLEKNGAIEALGAAAAVLGDPAEAVAMLANLLAGMGESLPAGSFVMSGGITEAIPVQAGDTVVVRFQELGAVSIRFVD